MTRTGYPLIFASLVLLAGCGGVARSLPSISSDGDGTLQPGRIVWHDLLSERPDASRRFYETLFGWEFEPVGSRFGLGRDEVYTLIRHNGRLIGGMVDANALNTGKGVSQWIALMSVNDVDAAVARVREDGGQVLTAPADLGARGRMAVVVDPQGALLGLLESRDGDPPQRPAEVGDFLWDELWTGSTARAVAFYGALAPLSEAELPGPAGAADYKVLQSGGRPRLGVMDQPFAGERPVWVSYLRVADPRAITSRVAGLGGRVIVEPRDRPRGGQVALIADPSGAGIALQTWPLERTAESTNPPTRRGES